MSSNTAPIPLTVVVPTYNEEAHLPELLPLLYWAAEIIVVDSMSTDTTTDIARAAGAMVLERPLDTIGQQKNWAMQSASYPWVLLLDADERPTPALVEAIRAIVQTTETPHVAYSIRRKNYFMGQPLHHGGLQRDRVLRLVQPAHCAYDHKQVHETMLAQGSIGQLDHELLHYTYTNLSFFLEKQRKYAAWSAQDHAARTPKVTCGHLFVKPLARFFIQYLLKRGFLDGKAGLVYCAINAWTVFLRYVYLLENRRNLST